MKNWLEVRYLASPQKIALYQAGTAFTYADLYDSVSKVAGALAERGIQKGHRVGLYAPNNFDTVCVIYALMGLGAILVPINRRLNLEEARWQIETARCQAVIVGDADTEFFASLTEPAFYPSSTLLNGPAIPLQPCQLEDDALIIYTSGTSGQPKGAILTLANLFYSATASAYRIGISLNDRWLCVLPLYHIGGINILVRSFLYGTSVDLYERFEIDTIDQALRDDPITLISLVPTMLYRLLKEGRPDDWNPHLRLILLGGAKASPELIELCQQRALPIATTYGLSEAASQVATSLPGDALNKVGTAGRPLLFSSIEIMDENGNVLDSGQVGEIVVSGLTVMRAYDQAAEATAKTLRDGKLHTGDIGYLDGEGDLFVLERRSDLIISGGENIYPSEIETCLLNLEAIEAAAVIGLPDPEWGQRVAAVLVLKAGHTITTAQLDTYCRQHLAAYKIPRHYRFVPALPLTASGKIKRQSLPALFEGE
ncbi:o-succinylbenzoate--CoA ligase [Anaerolineales bacterium]